MIEIIQALPSHVESLALRQHEAGLADRLEISAKAVLKLGVEKSTHSWSALVDGEVACIWGVEQESLIGGAHLWLVTTPLVEAHPRRFLRESRRFTQWSAARFGFVYSYVDINYLRSICWLEWLGFTQAEKSDLFYRYEMRG